VFPLIQSGQVDAEVGRYLNRLSDFLFVASRTAAMKEGKKEVIWQKAKDPPADNVNVSADTK
jgi:cob(I)alamin adenosyltransferase